MAWISQFDEEKIQKSIRIEYPRIPNPDRASNPRNLESRNLGKVFTINVKDEKINKDPIFRELL